MVPERLLNPLPRRVFCTRTADAGQPTDTGVLFARSVLGSGCGFRVRFCRVIWNSRDNIGPCTVVKSVNMYF